jgi:hypothetical protein
VGKGDARMSEPEGIKDEDSSNNRVETCALWQFLDYCSDSWVIGAAFVNISEE